MIEVGGKPIIAHVMDMFPGEQDVIFICNADHLAEPAYNMEQTLRGLRPGGRIAGIAPHRRGPVFAVSQVFDHIRDDEPVIVNYCDFTCYWDYAHFKRFVQDSGCDGAIPAYRGFHPHSLGSTFYAYVREQGGWASAIQEKQPYTDTPINEYASSGTYYFASGALMKEAFNEIMTRGIEVNGEHYASLAYIPLFERKKRVAVYELQHFMQWGTPQDLAEYRQYDLQFRALVNDAYRSADQAGTLLLPMAGAGSRFAQEGYQDPKPLIPVSGHPMAVAAANDLPHTRAQTFVLRHNLPQCETIANRMALAFPHGRITMLDQLTQGQAITCLNAMEGISDDAPLTIGACDTGLLYDASRFEEMLHQPDCDVIVWGFRGHHAAQRSPKSYGWIAADGDQVKNVSVKTPLTDPVHDPVVTGTFTFKKAAHFRAACERLIARDGRVNGEFYVDSCINDAIAIGLQVKLFHIDAYLCWGTPNELKTFEYWQSCFHKWASHPYSLSRDSRVASDAIAELEQRYAPRLPPLPRGAA
jgi:NDP-sugar pyrophosphorylase family protein